MGYGWPSVKAASDQVSDCAKLSPRGLADGRCQSVSLSFSLTNIIKGLLQPSGAQNEGSSSSHRSTQHRSVSADEGRSRPLPLVVVKLHAKDLQKLLDRAPDRITERAWLRGLALPGYSRRLKLCESIAAQRDLFCRDPSEVSAPWATLYEEGREWWSREAKL